MAFTKVVGAGIHTLSNITSHNINSSGIITATKFVGPFDGGGGINAGIVTCTTLDVNGNGDVSGNFVIDGNLTVNGTTSTIDTNLIGVDRVEVGANSNTLAGIAVTQSGTADLVRLYDGASQVVTVDDTGNIGIGLVTSPNVKLHVKSTATGGGNIAYFDDTGSGTTGRLMVLTTGGAATDGIKLQAVNRKYLHFGNAANKLTIDNNNSRVGINSSIPTSALDVSGDTLIQGQLTVARSTHPQIIIKDSDTNSPGDENGISFRSANNTQYGFIGQTSTGGHTMLINTTNTVNPIRLQVNSSTNLEIGYTGVYVDNVNFFVNGGHNAYLSGEVHIADSLIHQGDTDTKIRFPAANQIAFETAGSERLRIIADGKVGIGTVPSNYNLEVQGSGQQTILVGSTNATGALLVLDGDSNGDGAGGDYSYIAHDSSGDMLIATDNPNGNSDIVFRAGADDEKVRIKSDGKVGIGTDTPNGDLQIRAGQNASFRVLADPSTSGLFVGNYGSGDGYRSLSLLGSNIRLHTITAGALSGAVQRVHITPTGQVGIGTDTVRNNRTIQITGESGTTVLLTGFAPSIHFNGQSSTDSSNEDRSMIGQASGSNHLINGSSSGDTVLRGRGSGKLLVGMGSTVKMQLHDNGKFGIGTYPSTGVDIGYDVHIKKGSAEPSGQLLIQSHDTANSTAGIQFLARDNSNNNETCRILATSDSGENINLRLYTDNNSNKGMRINGSDGGVSFVGSSNSTLGYTFQNASGDANSDVRILVRTYSNYGADPYIKFDSGGTNHVVGQLYAGTTNNKLVLGAGESPSGGVSGIHIAGDGIARITDHIYMEKSSDPRIYSGSNVGLNIDGQALYLNRYVNSTIAMARGGGPVEVSNTTSGNDAQLNVYKSTGNNSDKAILRVGYDSNNSYTISRTRNSASIQVDSPQSGSLVHHTNTGDDTMILTNRNSVHIAKLAPMVIRRPHIQSNASWGGSRPYTFVMRFSTGNFSGTYHVARMISQHDWGFADWEAKVLRDYYSPDTDDGARTRYTGYYNSHSETVVTYNMKNNGDSGPYASGRRLSLNSNLGPGGAHKIHTAANGGYYKDAYATDYYVSLGTYSGVCIEVTVNNPGGWLKDQATSVTTIYPASFGNSASQSDADSWSYGRGIWFNVRPGVLDTSWWGYSSNFGQQTLPTS